MSTSPSARETFYTRTPILNCEDFCSRIFGQQCSYINFQLKLKIFSKLLSFTCPLPQVFLDPVRLYHEECLAGDLQSTSTQQKLQIELNDDNCACI
jgi:hypothetical protein